LHWLLTRLEPVTAELWNLVRAGYEANWLCHIASHATEHAAELDRQTMQRLLDLPGDLRLDVCGDSFDCGTKKTLTRLTPTRLRSTHNSLDCTADRQSRAAS
jgi:hypothetical protein